MGLDLIECLMNYGRRSVTLYRRQGIRPLPRKRNAKSKMAIWGGLTNSCEKKKSKKQRRKGKIYPFECRVLKNSTEKAMAPHSSTLVWKIPWTEEPGRLQSMG